MSFKEIKRFVVYLQAPQNFCFFKEIPLRYCHVMDKIYACRIPNEIYIKTTNIVW